MRILASYSRTDQELGLDHSSSAEALGITQRLTTTAADIGIPSNEMLENNVHTGVKYLYVLPSVCFSEPGLEASERINFSFVADNAGRSRMAQIRKKAAARGLDADRRCR